MAAMIFIVLLSFVATVLGGSGEVYKRALPEYSKYDGAEYQGYNNIEDYGSYSQYAHSLPAYSTVSYVMSNGHSKPVSYSGFTNHGRGHYDPGYSVQFRSEGFLPQEKSQHYY